MKKRAAGFTIVELLIVIVVIGILTTIAVVAYNGIQQRARDAARLAQVEQIGKLFDLYKTKNGKYPDVPMENGGKFYCIGTGFSGQTCIDTQREDDPVSTTINAQLQTVGTVPNGNRYDTTNNAGPFIYVESSPTGTNTVFEVGGVFEGKTCPDAFPPENTDYNERNLGRIWCWLSYDTSVQ